MSKSVRTVLLSIISVAILGVLGLTFSYAYFASDVNASANLQSQVAFPECASLSLSDSGGISLSGDSAAPISDEKIVYSTSTATAPYRYNFTINNNCGASSTEVAIALAPKTSSGENLVKSLRYLIVDQGTTLTASHLANIKYVATDASTFNLSTAVKNDIAKVHPGTYSKGYVLSNPTLSSAIKQYSLYLWVDYWENDITHSGLKNNSTWDQTFDGYLYISSLEMGESISNDLPDEFQKVEYIQGNGNQHIDTGITQTYNNGFRVIIESAINTLSQRYILVGAYNGSNAFSFEVKDNKPRFWYNSTIDRSGSSTLAANTKYKIEAYYNSGSYSVLVNDSSVLTGTATLSGTAGTTLWLFKDHRNNAPSTFSAYQKLYSFKYYENNVLLRDMVPCYRKSNGVIGLYDLVNRKFYPNAGTGSFTKGNDV